MRTQSVSGQNFTGEVHILKTLSSSEQKSIDKVFSQMQALVKEQNFDLFIKETSLGETIVGTDKSCGYPVRNGDYLRSAKLAVKDALNVPYMQRKMNAIKEVIANGGIL